MNEKVGFSVAPPSIMHYYNFGHVLLNVFLCALIISISNRVLNTPAITILLVCDKHFCLYMKRIYASTRGQRPPLLTLPPPNNLMIKLLATN